MRAGNLENFVECMPPIFGQTLQFPREAQSLIAKNKYEGGGLNGQFRIERAAGLLTTSYAYYRPSMVGLRTLSAPDA
jgi:hypothetical protein